jgi:phenylacetate-CoA ligase
MGGARTAVQGGRVYSRQSPHVSLPGFDLPKGGLVARSRARSSTNKIGIYAPSSLTVPASRDEIGRIQSERKKIAVERALRSRFWQRRLGHLRRDRLDDPEEWRKIPILDKEQLRSLGEEEFYRDFCVFEPADVCEYWRSGGSTGKPLFYPRTYEDIHYNMIGFTRTFACAGVRPGERAHVSFPLGIHPAGQMWARAAQIMGIGVVWAGSGAALPSTAQLDLIRMLKPTVWMGMSSYGLHLANLADARGFDLASSDVHTVMCTAEAVSAAKREKMEREWGATVYDSFGMTEVSMMGAESDKRDGFHIWTDLAFIEVLDPETWKPVPDGRPGRLVVTSLFSNNATPFLRWDSGDIVIYREEGGTDGPFSVFPVIRHAHRTAGFFKVRGVNVNHQEFEDFIFGDARINDFKLELASAGSGLDTLVLSVELRRGAETAATAREITERTKAVFEVTPEIRVLELGTLAKEFESSVKAPRFVDRRL